MVRHGRSGAEEERWEDALRCYREALARDPEAADVHVQLGYVLLHVGQAEEAETCFLAGLEADPSEYSAYLGSQSATGICSAARTSAGWCVRP